MAGAKGPAPRKAIGAALRKWTTFVLVIACCGNILADGMNVANWPMTYPVTGTFWQSVQPVSGALSITNFPASQPVTGTFWQATQPVSGSVSVGNFPATQPVSGSVSVSNFPASQAVTGTFWPATQPVSGSLSISNFPASQAVTGTFWQATQPVSIASMPSTPVTGSFWQATQPVSLASMPTTPVTGTFWQNTQPVSIASMPSTPVTGTFWQATQPVSIAAMPSTPVTGTFFQAVQPVSLGNATGKTNVGKPGTLATSATTADQVVVTYTVTAGKTFYVEWFSCNSRLTTFAATATLFGTCSLETPAGTKLITDTLAGPGIGDRDVYQFSEPLPIAAGAVIRVVTTPAAVTAMTWVGNIGGYEK
jgi:hypothetical protein